MPEATQYQFTHEELTKMMLKHTGITEGHWQLLVNFKSGATNFKDGDHPMLPTFIVGISSIGLHRVAEPTDLSVDVAAIDWQTEIEV